MKRKWAKKVKAGTACKIRRQAQTSAAMIGLMLSAGASNLILTRLSDSAPAAEPSVKESPVSSVSAQAATGQVGSSADQAKPLVEMLLAGDISFSTLLTPNPLVQLPAETPITSAIPATSEKQTRQALKLPAERVNPVSESSVATVFDRSLSQQKLLQALRVNRLVRQLKSNQTVAIISQSDTVNRSLVRSPVLAASFQLGQAEERSLAISEAQSTWTAKQRLLIDRLKQKSNRLQDSLAELRFEESGVRIQESGVTIQEERGTKKQKDKETRGNSPLTTVRAGRTVREGLRPTPLPLLTTHSVVQQPQAKVAVPNLPKIAVAQPTVVVPAALVPATALEYQVKAGDTLTAIAQRHEISLTALAKANRLNDPNQLQINQRLTIPTSRLNSTVAQKSGRFQPFQIQSASVPNEPLAVTPSLHPAYSGMGGEISDDDTVQATPLNVGEIQRVQSATAQEELLSHLYVQNLRTDIQKLRQKYNTEGVLTSQAVPGVNQTTTVPATTASSAEKILQKLPPYPLAEQLNNPEFSADRSAKTLQLDRQKQRPIPVRNRDGVATAPLGTDTVGSLQYDQERNVSPALPPLDGVDTYLPKPSSISAKGYIWPAKGRLTSGYGWRWGRMHKGIDIAAPVGTPIFASAAGVIVKAGWNAGGYGNMVDIQHADGSVTRYGHNKRLLVQAGQVVQQGEQISEMGSTGFSTGPHLHFEVHPLGKKAVNPIAYLPR